jgi:restriction system protein
MKRLWLVRLGRHGEKEAHGLDTGELVLGFPVGDLRDAKDRDAVLKIVEQKMPGKPKTQLNFAAQLNQFSNTIQNGDLVVVPLKTAPKIAIGEITGPCTPTTDGHPMRPVRWLKAEVPRDVFRQDLLYSFGAFMTVCEISRNDALQRVEAVIKTGRDPGYESGSAAPPRPPASPEAPTAEEADVDLDAIARDQIERRVASAFTGHDFTRLVAEILKVQGYIVNVSPPGPDSGIDIVAGRGALGFEAPRLVVQVKSGNTVADQPTLQALIGAVQDTNADQGLFVSWGGFKRPVEQRRNELFFRIRLWGRAEILDALFEVYDRLPEEFRAELPLRRAWMLVPEEEEASA